jgi:hypothetical protein
MKALRLETPFKPTALLVVIFVIGLTLLFLSDHVAILGELFNAHFSVGGVSILILVLVGGLDFLGLAFLIPWGAAILFRRNSARTWLNVFVVLSGALSLVLIGLWLVQVAFH